VGHRAADLRYLGQEHTVTIAIEDLGEWAELRQKFDAAHQRAYGYAAPDVEVQLLNLRLTVVFPLDPPRLPTLERRAGGAPVFETRKIYSAVAQDSLEHRVYQRDQLRAGDHIDGPAAIEEPGTTTLIDIGDTLSVESDVFIHNDPYTGNGNHLNDVAMSAPVFWEGHLTGFVAVKAHWSDVGGPVPSSMQVGSTDFRQEGLRFRSVRLVSRGELSEEV